MAAAAFAVGVGASMAQTVYSVNAVGYVNLTLKTGYNLIANPLNGTNNNVNTIMPVAPNGAKFIRWNQPLQTFFPSVEYFDVGIPDENGWYEGEFKSPQTIAPGEAFFVQIPQPINNYVMTFVGEVPQGNLTNTISANYSFVSSIVPQSVAIESTGFPGSAGMKYIEWNPLNQAYTPSIEYFVVPEDPSQNGFYNTIGDRVFPTPAVGQGFVIQNFGPALSWGRTFSVN